MDSKAAMVIPLAATLALSACQEHDAAKGDRSSKQVSATERDNGRTITLHRNDRLVIRLNSTYWTFARPKTTVFHEVGTPQTTTSPPGTGSGHCRAGAGCGTVTVTYDVVGPGQAMIAAHRTSCGEAIRCVGNAGTYKLTVKVS